MTPRPPVLAIAMASWASVTVSMAADTIGMASGIDGTTRVAVETSAGNTSDAAGSRSTSSKVRPSVANFSGNGSTVIPCPVSSAATFR